MALDKELKTLGKKQYHIHLKPGDIGKYVLLPGDPARSDRVAKYLDNAEFVAENREHRTFTGYYKGVKISVTSTGMGCPSATIAAEELMNIGAECLIRIVRLLILQERCSRSYPEKCITESMLLMMLFMVRQRSGFRNYPA